MILIYCFCDIYKNIQFFFVFLCHKSVSSDMYVCMINYPELQTM
jgi:hypothetical protein